MFKQVKQNKAYQDVAEQIQKAIMEDRLNPGTLLPAETGVEGTVRHQQGTIA